MIPLGKGASLTGIVPLAPCHGDDTPTRTRASSHASMGHVGYDFAHGPKLSRAGMTYSNL